MHPAISYPVRANPSLRCSVCHRYLGLVLSLASGDVTAAVRIVLGKIGLRDYIVNIYIYIYIYKANVKIYRLVRHVRLSCFGVPAFQAVPFLCIQYRLGYIVRGPSLSGCPQILIRHVPLSGIGVPASQAVPTYQSDTLRLVAPGSQPFRLSPFMYFRLSLLMHTVRTQLHCLGVPASQAVPTY